MTHVDVVVLGGGLSGLAAACALQESGADYLLLERCPTLGGLTRTAQAGDFCFDYTGHFLHLRRYASPSAIPFAGLRDDDWMSVERRSRCYVAKKMVTAPIQYHLGELPPDVLETCIGSYDKRPRSDTTSPISFREYIVRNFGSALADLFLVPQNEKTFAISLDRLSMNAVKRFFPVADDAAIRRGMTRESAVTAGYNNSFWYPKTGGIEALIRGFAKGLERFALNQEVCTVDLERRSVCTTGGLKIAWDALLTSMPLPSFCHMTGEPELVQAAKRLTHSATICVSIGMRGKVAPPLQETHWVYVPDAEIPFYRVGVYSNISEGTCSHGRAAIWAEFGVPADQLVESDLLTVQEDVITALERLGWLERGNVECVVMHVLHCAYVHHTPEAEVLVGQIFKRLSDSGVWPVGRYGRWDYNSMEDSFYDGLSTAARVLT
jgi:protoporphyrinogen oxidase